MVSEQSGSQTRERDVQTESLPELSSNEATRYSRHIVLPEIGQQGQRRLKASSVVVIGAGGLGSPAAMYLAAAGVGRIGIVDFDIVDLSNLQATDHSRQSGRRHGENRVGARAPCADQSRDRS
jgi:adenylyltransferase/sulfurtransferase